MTTRTLKSLTFTTFVKPKVSNADPVQKRRAQAIIRLEDQKRLCADPNYTRIVKKNGVEKQRRIRPMWFEVEDGKYVFLVKAGLEFQKGKSAIAVPSLSKLPSVIDTVIAAIRNGELDEQLNQAAAQTRSKLKRKAA